MLTNSAIHHRSSWSLNRHSTWFQMEEFPSASIQPIKFVICVPLDPTNCKEKMIHAKPVGNGGVLIVGESPSVDYQCIYDLCVAICDCGHNRYPDKPLFIAGSGYVGQVILNKLESENCEICCTAALIFNPTLSLQQKRWNFHRTMLAIYPTKMLPLRTSTGGSRNELKNLYANVVKNGRETIKNADKLKTPVLVSHSRINDKTYMVDFSKWTTGAPSSMFSASLIQPGVHIFDYLQCSDVLMFISKFVPDRKKSSTCQENGNST